MRDTKEFKCQLALLLTVAILGLVYLMMYIPIPAGSKDVILLVIGGLLARLSDVLSFYYGSSEGSRSKTEIMEAANVDTST